MDDFGAVFDSEKKMVVPVKCRNGSVTAKVPDGWYYTNNFLRIWNAPMIQEAVRYAIGECGAAGYRDKAKVVLGVPGAGKTYEMMKVLAGEYSKGTTDFLVVSATKKAAEDAMAYGLEFGIPEEVVNARVMTMDSYLCNKKFPASLVAVDEFPMVHIGRVDTVVSIAGASTVRLYGDAKQIPYDPFCAEFRMVFSKLAGSVRKENVTFRGESHRLTRDGCAMWVDQYPEIYPCGCCNKGSKEGNSYSWERVRSLAEIEYRGDVRYHTYKQEEKDELRPFVPVGGTPADLKLMKNKGLSTVHEDQGSTHVDVVTVRVQGDYNKHQSGRNPSLYNRLHYVLTDTTRNNKSYAYKTLSAERDEVIKRVELSRDPLRRRRVQNREKNDSVSVLSMLY